MIEAIELASPRNLIQPFVENSIVHGLLPKQKDRNLEVLISQEKSHLLCSIVDNGIGRVASKIMNEKRSSKHTSTGMALTQKRLKILYACISLSLIISFFLYESERELHSYKTYQNTIKNMGITNAEKLTSRMDKHKSIIQLFSGKKISYSRLDGFCDCSCNPICT